MTTGVEGSLERWERAQRYIPYGGLAIGFVLSVFLRDPDWPSLRLATAVTLAAVAWVRFADPLPGPVFFLGWTALATTLVACSPWYGFSVFVGYLFAVERLPGRWWAAGIAATAALVAVSQMGGLPPVTPAGAAVWFALWLVNCGLAGGFTYYGRLTEAQSDHRRRVIGELAETNDRLAAAMRENERLHAQLVASAREAGMQDERARLAREIHDTIAQGLAGVVAQLEAARRAAPADRDRRLDTAVELARSSLVEARRSVQALRPEPLESARLPDALAAVAARWSEVTGVPAAVTTTGEARLLHPEVEVALLRTGQEALANVGKHAGATRVGVTLSYMEDVVTLDVRDDGTGFDPAGLPGTTADGSGYGLSVMRQRVTRVAGRLEIESAPGEGTAVSATVPAVPA